MSVLKHDRHDSFLSQAEHRQPPDSLVAFQKSAGAFFRDPHHTKRPSRIPYHPAQVYSGLLFSAVCDFLDRCFVISQRILSEKRWRRLCRVFYRDWPCSSPQFIDIPKAFVEFLQAHSHQLKLPMWFAELAHYEWLELAVDIDPATLTTSDSIIDLDDAIKQATQFTSYRLSVNPTLANQHYHWPVHEIGPTYKPRRPKDTFIAVYRNSDHDVQFLYNNAMTYALIAFIEAESARPDQQNCLLSQFAAQLQYPEPDVIIKFGKSLIADLITQQALLIHADTHH